MKKSKPPKVQYGRSYRYGSTEAAIRDLTRIEKKQKAEKERKAKDDKR